MMDTRQLDVFRGSTHMTGHRFDQDACSLHSKD